MGRIDAVVSPSLFARSISKPPHWPDGRPISREAVITTSRWAERANVEPHFQNPSTGRRIRVRFDMNKASTPHPKSKLSITPYRLPSSVPFDC